MMAKKDRPAPNIYWTIKQHWNGVLWAQLWPNEAYGWREVKKQTGKSRAQVEATGDWSMVRVHVSELAPRLGIAEPPELNPGEDASAVPSEIKGISGLIDADRMHLPVGVYFLYFRGVLQYVGKSIAPASRLHQHRQLGRVFDRAFVLPVPQSMMDQAESALIRRFRPPLNVTMPIIGLDDDANVLSKLGFNAEIPEEV
jgi:hypothetical protein